MQALMLLLCLLQTSGAAADLPVTSETIAEVVREALPPEDLSCTVTDTAISVQGPTFRYTIDRANGAVSGLDVTREGKRVITLREPVALRLDDSSLTGAVGGATRVLKESLDQVVLSTECLWVPGVPCTVTTTIFNDGVLVSEVTLTPEADLVLRQGIRCEASAAGRFSHYLHKRRDTNGMDCYQGALPQPGETARLNTPTSCLEVYSDEAALALFTDMGDFYRSPASLDTAAVRVNAVEDGECLLNLHQHLIHAGPDGDAYTLRAGKAFNFRVGLAVAPNRLPHPRWRDLRMFIWVGDGNHPYPSDAEIHAAAQLGYTLFQMHRLGPPGAPRPPVGELERVLKTVHDTGMFFIWTANADLMYRHDPEVVKRIEGGRWAEWQGFNYGGQYKASMDAFCDTLATCLASPNGLADYRIECDKRMLERYPVDGMYIDDNLAYENCTLWKEHGHPQQVYDCLIELHEINWRRRQALRAGCPHAVLIDHCSHGFVLPVIAPFDCHLFGEGYTFASVESYRDTFGAFNNMYAQGCLWAGDSETTRCGAERAYAFDLLTGGGQYSYLDWRLWPEKFPYASGVNKNEPLFVSTYNLAQYYFGLYESTFSDSLETTVPGSYAALYHNRVWNDALVALANMNDAGTSCSLAEPNAPAALLNSARPVVVYDVHARRTLGKGPDGNHAPFVNVPLHSSQLRLFYLRTVPENSPYHLWGGKRLAEQWNAGTGNLSLLLDGPEGVEEVVVLGTGGATATEILINAQPAVFFHDKEQDLVFGNVVFGKESLRLEARFSATTPKSEGALPGKAIEPGALGKYYAAQDNDT